VSELFTEDKITKDQEDGQAKEAELFQQMGRLQMELEWLKTNLVCSDARELRKLVDHAHAELSVSRQCTLLGLPRSTPYYRPKPVRDSRLRIMARIDALYLEDPSPHGLAGDLPETSHHPATEEASVFCGDHGSPFQTWAQLEAFQQPWHGVLPGSPGDSAGRRPKARDLPFRSGLTDHIIGLRSQAAD